MSMAVVLKPSRLESAGTPKAVAAAAETLLVAGSSMKLEGTGTVPVPGSATTQVVAGATAKEPTTAVSVSGKALFRTAVKMGWYWSWSSCSWALQAESRPASTRIRCSSDPPRAAAETSATMASRVVAVDSTGAVHTHAPVAMSYAIEAVGEKLATRAGSFDDCLRVRGRAAMRLFADPVVGWKDMALTTTEWYCAGVGLVKLVREALHERATLLANAPHLAQPLPFVMPAYQWWEAPFYGIGLKMYW